MIGRLALQIEHRYRQRTPRLMAALLTGFLTTLLAPPSPQAAEPAGRANPFQQPRIGSERVVLRTVAGDIVLGLYPDVAPQHVAQILRLVNGGLYDTTAFVRLHPGFVLQLSHVLDRRVVLRSEQSKLIGRIPGEFSPIPHRRGLLSMARPDGEPDGAETSFSIMLGDAPHLDGRYTVFGEVVEGMDVVALLESVRQKNYVPITRLTVERGLVFPDAKALSKLVRRPPTPVGQPSLQENQEGLARTMLWGLAGIVVLGLGAAAGSRQLSKRNVLSFVLAQVLVAAVLLYVLLEPMAQGSPWLAAGLFIGSLALFRIMGRFE